MKNKDELNKVVVQSVKEFYTLHNEHMIEINFNVFKDGQAIFHRCIFDLEKAKKYHVNRI